MYTDALYDGWFAVDGNPLLGGWFPAGESVLYYYNIYGGRDGIIDYDTPLAASIAANQASAAVNIALPPNSVWQFTRTKVAVDCDLQSPPSRPVTAHIGPDGHLLPASPAAVAALIAEAVAGAKIRLRWRYVPTPDSVRPTKFDIFIDDGSGFDFASPDDSVAYVSAGSYAWISPTLIDGKRYRFVARSTSVVTGGSSRNTSAVSAIADSTGPQAITGIIAVLEDAV